MSKDEEQYAMKIMIELTDAEAEDFRGTLQNPKAIANIDKWKSWKDWWKKAEEDELKDEMVECLCSTQQRTEAPRYREFIENTLVGLRKKPRKEIEATRRRIT